MNNLAFWLGILMMLCGWAGTREGGAHMAFTAFALVIAVVGLCLMLCGLFRKMGR